MDKRMLYKTAVLVNKTEYSDADRYVSVNYVGDNYYCTVDTCGVVRYIHEKELTRLCL